MLIQRFGRNGAAAAGLGEGADLAPLTKAWIRPAVEGNPLLAPTVFHQDWWLDIVSRGTFRVIESKHAGQVVGRMPIVMETRYGFRTIRMPMLTHFLGPAVDPGKGSPNTKFLTQMAINRDLIEQIPKVHAFSQKCHRGVDEVIAFQMQDFETAVQFTHELQPRPADELWRGMRDKTRNVARQAEKLYTIEDRSDADEFVALYKKNLDARQWSETTDMEVMRELIASSCARGQGGILFAQDKDHQNKAAVFCVWDRTACYYLLSTRTLDSGNGAITLLLWNAIQRAAAGGMVFDFDGFGYAGAVLFYTGFGAQVKPRYIVKKTGTAYRWLREARRVLVLKDNPFT